MLAPPTGLEPVTPWLTVSQGHKGIQKGSWIPLVCSCALFCFIYLSITLERSGRMLENAHACSKLCWKLAGLSNFHAERLETLLPLCCACGGGSKVFNGSVWIWRRSCSFQWSIGGYMKVLIACEESQAVCKEMRRLGHEAYSADIQDCSGGYPEWHLFWLCQLYRFTSFG